MKGLDQFPVTEGLFGAATLLLAGGQYAAGAWVAGACAVRFAWRAYTERRADHPQTLQAIADMQSACQKEFVAIGEVLEEMKIKQQFVATTVSAAFPARQAQQGPLRSPLRPPTPR